MDYVDGNVLAGPTTELFAFESTTARGRCRSCADIATLAQALVYGQPMGYVARCRNCDNVLMIIVERQGQRSLSMHGFSWVQVADRGPRNAIGSHRQ